MPEDSRADLHFSSRVIIGKHLQRQGNVLHNFIDFKKAFDRGW